MYTSLFFNNRQRQALIHYCKLNNPKDIQRLDDKLEKYSKVLISSIIKWKGTVDPQSPKIISLPLNQIREDRNGAGRFKVNGKLEWVHNIINKVSPVYLVLDKGTGFKAEVSKIQMPRNIEDYLDAVSPEHLVAELFGDVDLGDPNVCDLVSIDIKSLTAYVNWAESLPPENISVSLTKQIKESKRLLKIATYFYENTGEAIIPHIKKHSEFGRTYYIGTNLQSCSKKVRQAALGKHYEYDLNSAVYAIKYYMVSEILKSECNQTQREINQLFPNTVQYIEDGGKFKVALRKRLAKVAFNLEHDKDIKDYHIEKIKQAITMVGFGAKLNSVNGYYNANDKWVIPSIAQIFGFKGGSGDYILTEEGQVQFNRLRKNEWFSGFAKEQASITQFIVQHAKEKGVVDSSMTFLLDKAGRFSTAKVISYLFQQAETDIMEKIISMVDKENVVLRVHDAFYTNKPIDIADIMMCLNKDYPNDSFTLFKLGKKEYDRFVFVPSNYNIEHRNMIMAEERFAKGYKSIFTSNIDVEVTTPTRVKLYDSSLACGPIQYDDNYEEEYFTQIKGF